MTNFVSHVKDAGLNPDTIPLTFFRKTSGSISGPFDDIIRPAHVRCLDYEVEIGLVIGRELPVGTQVTADNWTSFVAGLVVTNDVSARDVQLPKTQFFESKSYPTFTPVGPSLVLLDDDELKRFGDLRLRLWVNGELRQNSTVDGDMIYSPLEALQALSRFQRLDPGDLLLTGTPEGTALRGLPKPVEVIAAFLPPALKWKIFFQRQAQNPKYLKHGDVVEVAIGTDDGAIDLGRQHTAGEGRLMIDLLWPTYDAPGDLAAIEAVPLADRGLPGTTYELLVRAATAVAGACRPVRAPRRRTVGAPDGADLRRAADGRASLRQRAPRAGGAPNRRGRPPRAELRRARHRNPGRGARRHRRADQQRALRPAHRRAAAQVGRQGPRGCRSRPRAGGLGERTGARRRRPGWKPSSSLSPTGVGPTEAGAAPDRRRAGRPPVRAGGGAATRRLRG